MIRRMENDRQLSDEELPVFLRRHAPLAPMGSVELAALEAQILAQAGIAPRVFDFTGPEMPAWLIQNQPWLRRGAVMATVLLLAMGYMTGRGLVSELPAAEDPLSSYVFASGTAWQTFLTSPSMQLQGETDEDVE